MAPSGLQKFMEKIKNAYYTVDIVQAIEEERKRDPTRKPLLVLDGSCSRNLFVEKDKERHLSGGQYQAYKRKVDEFVQFLDGLNVEVVVFFDAGVTREMTDLWVSRKKEMVKRCYQVLDAIDNGGPVNFWDIPVPLSIVTVIKSRMAQRFQLILSTFRECDEEIVSYANSRRAMAVLSQDADFAVAQGSWKYWSYKDLDMKAKTVKVYDRVGLARYLKLRVDQLPLFRTMIGNDYVVDDTLKDFFRRLGDPGFGPARINKVARFVAGFSDSDASLLRLARYAFGDAAAEEKCELLKMSIESYHGREYERRERLSDDNTWNEMLQLTLDMLQKNRISPDVFNAMHNRRLAFSVGWEDFRKSDIMAAGLLWRPLRANAYGILLREAPNPEHPPVEEWVCVGQEDLQRVHLVKPVAPTVDLKGHGLREFWCEEKSDELTAIGWALFASSVEPRLPVRRLMDFAPRRLLCVALAILRMIGPCRMSEHEVDAFLLVATLCGSGQDVSKLVPDRNSYKINTRALRLSTNVLTGLRALEMLSNAAGFVIPMEGIEIWNVFDGDLLQLFFSDWETMASYKKHEDWIKAREFVDELRDLFN